MTGIELFWNYNNEQLNELVRRQIPPRLDIEITQNNPDLIVCLNDTGDYDKPIDYLFETEPSQVSATFRDNRSNVRNVLTIREFYFPQLWRIDKTYDELSSLRPNQVKDEICMITSDLGRIKNPILRYYKFILSYFDIDGFFRHLGYPFNGILLRYPVLTGHYNRYRFIKCLDESGFNFDIFGRGDFKFPNYRGSVEDKFDVHSRYKYSIVVENTRENNYWSEKLADALLSWSLPFYFGCGNLDEFLPRNSFINIDINDPESAISKMNDAVESDEWSKRLDSIEKARDLILDEYSLISTIGRLENINQI